MSAPIRTTSNPHAHTNSRKRQRTERPRADKPLDEEEDVQTKFILPHRIDFPTTITRATRHKRAETIIKQLLAPYALQLVYLNQPLNIPELADNENNALLDLYEHLMVKVMAPHNAKAMVGNEQTPIRMGDDAFGGTTVFAKSQIDEGQVVMFYWGMLRTRWYMNDLLDSVLRQEPAPYDDRSVENILVDLNDNVTRNFELDKLSDNGNALVLIGSRQCVGGYLNHDSKEPNCKIDVDPGRYTEQAVKGEPISIESVSVVALRTIAANEPLTFDYGNELKQLDSKDATEKHNPFTRLRGETPDQMAVRFIDEMKAYDNLPKRKASESEFKTLEHTGAPPKRSHVLDVFVPSFESSADCQRVARFNANVHGLEIRESTLSASMPLGANQGLFAMKRLDKDVTLGYYFGYIRPLALIDGIRMHKDQAAIDQHNAWMRAAGDCKENIVPDLEAGILRSLTITDGSRRDKIFLVLEGSRQCAITYVNNSNDPDVVNCVLQPVVVKNRFRSSHGHNSSANIITYTSYALKTTKRIEEGAELFWNYHEADFQLDPTQPVSLRVHDSQSLLQLLDSATSIQMSDDGDAKIPVYEPLLDPEDTSTATTPPLITSTVRMLWRWNDDTLLLTSVGLLTERYADKSYLIELQHPLFRFQVDMQSIRLVHHRGEEFVVVGEYQVNPLTYELTSAREQVDATFLPLWMDTGPVEAVTHASADRLILILQRLNESVDEDLITEILDAIAVIYTTDQPTLSHIVSLCDSAKPQLGCIHLLVQQYNEYLKRIYSQPNEPPGSLRRREALALQRLQPVTEYNERPMSNWVATNDMEAYFESVLTVPTHMTIQCYQLPSLYRSLKGLIAAHPEKSCIILPFNETGGHWVAYVIDLKQNTVWYFDSMGGSSQYADATHEIIKWMKRVPQIVDVAPNSPPLQRNGFDCGVFVMLFVKEIVQGASPTEAVHHIRHMTGSLRNTVASELLNSERTTLK